MKALVIFLGSIIAGDDSAGYAVYKHLGNRLPSRTLFLGTDLFRLYGVYEGEEKLVIIDAMHGIRDVVHLCNEDLFAITNKSQHAHMLSAVEALKILKATMHTFPKEVHLVGVPARSFDCITYDEKIIKKAADSLRAILS